MTSPHVDLDTPILTLPFQTDQGHAGVDHWTLRDACEGTQVFGTTGSGKTSGSGQAIARAFLTHGFGGLVLCAKVDERETWERYARDTGREDDLIIFSAHTPYRFNFMAYEVERGEPGSGLADNIANLFLRAMEFGEDHTRKQSKDPFWERATLQMIRNSVDILVTAGERVGLDEISRVITSAPQSQQEALDTCWAARSYFHHMLWQGDQCYVAAGATDATRRDFDRAATYWVREFPRMAPETRASVISTFTGMSDGLLRGLMYELFSTTTTVKPEFSHLGAIIVLDLPIKSYGVVGRIAQGVFKYLWQQAAERRDVRANPRPVFLWADESQFFVNSYDALFQTTARSSRACTVYLTQNISNYYAAVGGEQAKAAVDSLLGNFQTKIFHTNGDAVTNTWASDQISVGLIDRHGSNVARDSTSITITQEWEALVQPSAFLRLRNGGHSNNLEVDAVIVKAGRIWNASGQPHRTVRFSQTLGGH